MHFYFHALVLWVNSSEQGRHSQVLSTRCKIWINKPRMCCFHRIFSCLISLYNRKGQGFKLLFISLNFLVKTKTNEISGIVGLMLSWHFVGQQKIHLESIFKCEKNKNSRRYTKNFFQFSMSKVSKTTQAARCTVKRS